MRRLLRCILVVTIVTASIALGSSGFAAAEPPTASDDAYSTPRDQSLVVAAPGVLQNDEVPAGGRVSVDRDPDHGQVTLEPDGSFTYVPDPGFTGTDTFDYALTEPDPTEELRSLGDLAPGSTDLQVISVASTGTIGLFVVQSATVQSSGSRAYDLWRTDGTAAGTFLLRELNAGGELFLPGTAVLTAGDVGYFRAADPLTGVELWRTDGTADGTAMVADLASGPGNSNPTLTSVVGDRMYFSAFDGSRTSIYSTVGSAADLEVLGPVGLGGFAVLDDGTVIHDRGGEPAADGVVITDLNPEGSSLPSAFSSAGDRVVFSARRQTPTGFSQYSLYSTTGEVGSADQIVQMSGSGSATVAVDGGVFASTPFGYTDGATWQPLPGGISPSALGSATRALGSTLVFAGDDAAGGTELWRSDGTLAGTGPVIDLAAGTTDSSPRDISTIGDLVYFSAAADGVHRQVWRTDLSAAGTERVVAADEAGPGGLSPSPFRVGFVEISDEGVLLFADDGSTGVEPWLIHQPVAEEDIGTVTIHVIGPAPTVVADDHPVSIADRVSLSPSVVLTITEPVGVVDRPRDRAPSDVEISIRETVAVSASTTVARAIVLSFTEAIHVEKMTELRSNTVVLEIGEAVVVGEQLAHTHGDGPALQERTTVADDVAVRPSVVIRIGESSHQIERARVLIDGGGITSEPGVVTFAGVPLGIVVPGTTVRFVGGGFRAGSPVRIELRSEPITLATAVADEAGDIDVTVEIPADAPPGPHELVGVGSNPGGGLHELRAPLTIAAPRDISATGASGASRFVASVRIRRGEPQGNVVVRLGAGPPLVADDISWVAVSGDVAIVQGTGTIDGTDGHLFVVVLREGRAGAGAFGAWIIDPDGDPVAAVPVATIDQGRIRIG